MKYAVVSLQGKQYYVTEGRELAVDRLSGEAGEGLNLDQVLLLVEGEKRPVGQPLVTNASVTAKILGHARGQKIRVSTYKSKSRYHKTKGHRSQITKILVESIKAN